MQIVTKIAQWIAGLWKAVSGKLVVCGIIVAGALGTLLAAYAKGRNDASSAGKLAEAAKAAKAAQDKVKTDAKIDARTADQRRTDLMRWSRD